MPSNLTRRTFVQSLGAGLVASSAWPAAIFAGDRAVPRFSFLVITDTHLGRGDNPAAARQWERTVRELDAAPGDFVLHLGDVVDDGREAQYGVYREQRARQRKTVHEIPGNHDPQDLFERHIRRQVDTSFDHQGVRFVLFNNSRRDSHNGFITPAQVTWIETQIGEAARRNLFVILCCHVPLHDNRHPDRGWHVGRTDGQEAVYTLLRRHPQRILALMHGHFHNGIRGWNDHGSLQEICFPSALYNQDRRLAEQRAPGFYLSELRPGYVKVSLDARGMALRYQPLGDIRPAERLCPLPQFEA